MALKATIYKVELQISDIDRSYYATHPLTLAQHPSETIERMMLRLAVFALHAEERLQFSRGLSADDEPDIWLKNYSDEIELWIELGEPDERRLRQASGRADKVWLYSYGGRVSDVWWAGIATKLTRLDNLTVARIDNATLAALAGLCQRSMALQATIQDGQMWLSDGERNVLVEAAVLKDAK